MMVGVMLCCVFAQLHIVTAEPSGVVAECLESVRRAAAVSPFIENNLDPEYCLSLTDGTEPPGTSNSAIDGVKDTGSAADTIRASKLRPLMPRHSSLPHVQPLEPPIPHTMSAQNLQATETRGVGGKSGDVEEHEGRAVLEAFGSHVTSLLELEEQSTQPGVAGGGVSMIICYLICQMPDNRKCMVPCLKHVRCVELLSDPIKSIGMLEVATSVQDTTPSMRRALLMGQESDNTPYSLLEQHMRDGGQEMSLERVMADSLDDQDTNAPLNVPEIDLGPDLLSDYSDARKQQVPRQNALPQGALPATRPGVQSGLFGLKGTMNSMGPSLMFVLALLYSIISSLVLKFLGYALEMFVKFRCFMGFYMPEVFMAGMCGWRCNGKALCVFRCLDSFACCDMYECTTKAMKKVGIGLKSATKMPSILTECSDRDCKTSAFGCGKNGKHMPMFGRHQVKLIKMMFGSDEDIMEGVEKQKVFPFWMIRLVSQELSIGKGLEAIESVGNDYDEHMKRVLYYMGR